MIEFKKAIAPIARRIQLAIGRAVLSAVQDGGNRQFIQFAALKGETKDKVERVQEYGFTSHPHPGAQVVFVCVAGNRDHPVAVAVDDARYRLKGLTAGEVAIYTDEGDTIILKRGNTVEITTQNLVVKASEKARFETPLLECTGDIIDNVSGSGQSMSGMRTVYNGHTHNENNTPGGPTNTPNQPMGA